MICKSCGSESIYWRKLCQQCTSDYRYILYRRNLEKRQAILGKPISQYWARKPRFKTVTQ